MPAGLRWHYCPARGSIGHDRRGLGSQGADRAAATSQALPAGATIAAWSRDAKRLVLLFPAGRLWRGSRHAGRPSAPHLTTWDSRSGAHHRALASGSREHRIVWMACGPLIVLRSHDSAVTMLSLSGSPARRANVAAGAGAGAGVANGAGQTATDRILVNWRATAAASGRPTGRFILAVLRPMAARCDGRAGERGSISATGVLGGLCNRGKRAPRPPRGVRRGRSCRDRSPPPRSPAPSLHALSPRRSRAGAQITCSGLNLGRGMPLRADVAGGAPTLR